MKKSSRLLLAVLGAGLLAAPGGLSAAEPGAKRAAGARRTRKVVVSPPSIVKSFASATVPLNGSVTLTFTITNPNGATDLTGVSFVDNFPAGLVLANPDSVFGTCNPGVLTTSPNSFSLVGGTILAGSSCTFGADVLGVAAGTQVNTTDPVTSNEGGTGGTATASVEVLLPDLAIAKTHAGSFHQGQKGATYTITVTNVGGATTTDPVLVTETVPVGLKATSISGSNWSCTQPSGPCSRVGGLDAGMSFEAITLTVDVAPDALPSLTNSVQVSGGGEANGSNDVAQDATTIAGEGFTVLGPCRILDTREGSGSLAAGETRVVPVLASGCGVPPGAVGLAINVTAVAPAQAGLLQVYAADQPTPATSVVSFGPGQTRASSAIVALASDGSGGLAIRNVSTGTVDVLIDVMGALE